MAKQKGINTTQTFLPQRLHSVENSWRHEKPTAKLGFSRYINDSRANVACCGIAVPARAAKFIRLRSVLELVRPCPNFRRGMQVTWSSSTGMLVAKTLRADTSYAEVTNSSVVLFATRVIIVVQKKADIMVEHYKLSALEAGWMGDSQAHELYWHLSILFRKLAFSLQLPKITVLKQVFLLGFVIAWTSKGTFVYEALFSLTSLQLGNNKRNVSVFISSDKHWVTHWFSSGMSWMLI